MSVVVFSPIAVAPENTSVTSAVVVSCSLQHLWFLFVLQLIILQTADLPPPPNNGRLLSLNKELLIGWFLLGEISFSSLSFLTSVKSSFPLWRFCPDWGLKKEDFLKLFAFTDSLSDTYCFLGCLADIFLTLLGIAVLASCVSPVPGRGYLQQGWPGLSWQLNFSFKQNVGANLAGFAVVVDSRLAWREKRN